MAGKGWKRCKHGPAAENDISKMAGAGHHKVMLAFTDGVESAPPVTVSMLPGIRASKTKAYGVGLGRPHNT